MNKIIAAVGAAIAINKGINIMTENDGNRRNIWFRIFRAMFWASLSASCALGVLWLARQVIS